MVQKPVRAGNVQILHIAFWSGKPPAVSRGLFAALWRGRELAARVGMIRENAGEGGTVAAAQKSKKPRKPNWARIQAEYVTGQISQRELAKKHGIPLRTIQDRSRAEKWVEKRAEHRGATVAKACDLIAESQARDTAALITRSAEKLLEAANAAIGQLQTPVSAWKVEEETDTGKTTREYLTLDVGNVGAVDPKALRNIAGALKDIAQVLNLRPELERQEQEARIAALRARAPANSDDDDTRHGVVLLPQAEPMKPPEEDGDG